MAQANAGISNINTIRQAQANSQTAQNAEASKGYYQIRQANAGVANANAARQAQADKQAAQDEAIAQAKANNGSGSAMV